MQVYGEWFYGNKISDYGLENGYVDYGTFAKAFDAVLANDLMRVTADIGWWESVGASEYDEEDDSYHEVFQWYIVDENGAKLCQEAGEIVYYNEELDLYLWGVTHYGTAWNYVLTDIKCKTGEV